MGAMKITSALKWSKRDGSLNRENREIGEVGIDQYRYGFAFPSEET
jgi:hypothetical protein